MPYVLACLSALAILAVQALYGGAVRPVFALPGYLVLGGAGVLGMAALFRKGASTPRISCLAATLTLGGFLIFQELRAQDAWLAGSYLRLTLGCLAIYFLFACVVTSAPHRITFVVCLLVAALVQAGFAVLQFTQAQTGMPFPWLSEQVRQWYSGRVAVKAHGFFLNGNHLAWFLNVAGIMAVSLACWGRWPVWKKILGIYVAGVCMAGGMLCLSRGGVISLAASLVVFAFLSGVVIVIGVQDRRLSMFAAVLAGLLVASGGAFALYQNSFSAQKRFSIFFIDEYRSMVWPAVFRQFQIQPETGTGPGSFLNSGRMFRSIDSVVDDVYAHNDWAQIAADFGYPAFAMLVFFCMIHVVAGWRGLIELLRSRMVSGSRPQSNSVALRLGALTCFAGFAVHSFLDFNMQMPANALLAAAITGMLANTGVEDRVGRGFMEISVRGMAIGAMGGCALWLLVLSGRTVSAELFWLRAENSLLKWNNYEAEALAQEGLEKFPYHPRLRRLLGEALLRRSNSSVEIKDRLRYAHDAAKELKECVVLAPWDRGNHILLAEAWIRAGQGEKARLAAVEAIKCDPTQPLGHEYYAVAQEMLGRNELALRIYGLTGNMWGATISRQRMGELQKQLQKPARLP